jgi:hypothetical protein
LGTVVDSGQHDERADRGQAKGDRQKHRNRRDGSYAREDTHQCADECAKQTKTDVVWMRGDRETEREIGEEFTHDGFRSVPGPKLERQP